jgi:hypothetical protein
MRTTALLSGLLCLLFGMPVAACSCVSSDPPASFNDAKAVFIAEVIDGTQQLSIPSGQGASTLKGEAGRDATVISSDHNNSCGILDLRRGKQYVFELRVRIVDRRGRSFNNTRPQLQEVHLINDRLPSPNDGSPVGAGGDFRVRGVPPR